MDRVVRGVKQMSVEEDSLDFDDIDQSPNPDSDLNSFEDLPPVLIVTNVDDSVFDNTQSRAHFEAVFRDCDPSAQIHFLKSFRRARVMFGSSLLAAQAKIQLHEAEICGRRIKLFFAMALTNTKSSSPHLLPPAPEKQFLISPPASPPVGWEPITESEPVINYDLLEAIARLQPGEAHELHPASASAPGIVVHICEDPEGYQNGGNIAQTRCPVRQS